MQFACWREHASELLAVDEIRRRPKGPAGDRNVASDLRDLEPITSRNIAAGYGQDPSFGSWERSGRIEARAERRERRTDPAGGAEVAAQA
jgi:hypothetical protein